MQQIEYTTTGLTGQVLTCTGSVYRSRNPWKGKGERPTIAFAPGTQGTPVHCNPSVAATVGLQLRVKPFDFISAYEQPAINYFVAAGCDVVVTDYPREPETNTQLYCNHVVSARALMDGVRAAAHLGVGTSNLGLWGFSQGGGTVAAWLEDMNSTDEGRNYAPDLTPLAAVCGAPPSDLMETLKFGDGHMATFALPYALAGIMASDPELAAEIEPFMNEKGRRFVAEGSARCVVGSFPYSAYRTTSTMTTNGKPLPELLDQLPKTVEYLEKSRIGRGSVSIPTLLWASVNDDVVPHSTAVALAKDWGITLDSRKHMKLFGNNVANHLLPYFRHLPHDANWLLAHLGAQHREG
nr:lipase family protein [Corynebacterium aquatimens]